MTRSRVLVLLTLCAAALRAPLAEAQGRIVVETLHSKALRGNRIGDTPDRRITIYLPPSYDREPARRYPAVYLLHGSTSDPREWLDGSYQGLNLALALDALAAAGLPEYIVVMPRRSRSRWQSAPARTSFRCGWRSSAAWPAPCPMPTRWGTGWAFPTIRCWAIGD